MTRSNLRLILFAFAVILACGCLVSQAAYADAQDLQAQNNRAEYTVKSVMLDQKADMNGDVERGVIERKLTKDEVWQNQLLNEKPLDYVKAPYLGRPNEVKNLRVAGDNIAEAIAVTAVPYDTIGTTSGFIDDYNEGAASTSPDVVFAFTPGADMFVTISTCNDDNIYDTKLFVYNTATPTPGTYYALNDDFAGCTYDPYFSTIENLCVRAGETYYIVVDGYGGDYGQYELTIDEAFPAANPGCALTIPALDFEETKSCFGEYDPNGGWNEVGEPMDDIDFDETVGGTIWSFAGFRDLDWYAFSTTETKNVRFFGGAEAPWIFLLVNVATQSVILNNGGITPCVVDTMEALNLAAGDYIIIMTTSDWYDDYLCCTGNETEYEYWFSMEEYTFTSTPGDDCSDPIVINYSGSYDDLGQTTCGRVDDYNATGMGYYDGGEDIIYELNIAAPTTFNMDLVTTSTWTGMAIFETCPPGATALYSVGSSTGNKSLKCVSLDPGTYYIMIDTWPSPTCIPSFDLHIFDTTCVVNPGDNCSDPIVINYTGSYSDLGQTTCGRFDDYNATGMGSYDGGEDIIYELNVPTAKTVNIRMTTTETYTGVGLFSTCPPGATAIAFATNYSSGGAALTCQTLAAGTYYLMIDTYPAPTCIPSFDLVISDTTCFAIDGDVCETAIEVFDGPNYGTNVGAQNGAAFPGSNSTCGTSMNNDVWYYYESTCSPQDNGELTVTTIGTAFDTKLGVYLGLPDCTDLYALACNDDYSGLQSGVVLTGVSTGLPFYFQVASYGASTEGAITLNIECFYCDPQDVPCNDDCANLTSVPCPGYESGIPVLNRGDVIVRTGNNECATAAGCAYWETSLWEAFTLTEALSVTIDYAGSANNVDGGPFGNAWIIIETACPCTTTPVYYSSYGFGPDGNVFINFDLPAGTYYYPVLKDAAYDAVGDYVLTITAPPYCIPGANSAYEYIERVQLGTIDNATGPETGGYGDYSALQTLVYKGASYPATVTVADAYSSDVVGAWVDWNLDYTFNPVTEFIAFTGGNSSDPLAVATVDVPVTAVADVTRIRIQLVDASFDPLDPCGNVGAYGEYEDYSLLVEDLPCGDVNMDDAIDGADVQYLIDFYFNLGAAPLPIVENGDANGDCCVGIADIVYLAEHVYRQGPDPICLPCQP